MSDYKDFLNDLCENDLIDTDTKEKILSCENLDSYFQEKKQSLKKSSEERAGEYDPHKCQVRIWKEGYDNIQCDKSIVEGGQCYCTRHMNKVNEHGSWWLGLITDKRPENPVHYNGTKHSWKKDNIEEKIETSTNETTEEKPKKKRGRPKGSKNKKTKENTKKKDSSELTTEELMALITQKENEEKQQTEDDNSYILEGVSYFKNDDGSVIDTNDFSMIGTIEDGNFTFANKETEEKHKMNTLK